MQSIDLIETYVYETSKDLVSEKELIKWKNIIKRYKNAYLSCCCKRKYQKHNPNWPQIPDHPCKILIIGSSGSGKTNSLFNQINYQPDIDLIYLHTKDPSEAKYQFLINKRESAGLKHFNGYKAFIEYLNDMD